MHKLLFVDDVKNYDKYTSNNTVNISESIDFQKTTEDEPGKVNFTI